MGKFYNITLAVLAATGSFLFGYDSGVMTDVIQSKNFLAFFDASGYSATIGAINSTFSGGAVFGSLMGGLTMDRFGRKMTVQIGACICLVGAILQSAAANLSMMLVGRIFAGWAVGLMSMSIPVYLSECAHPRMRGLIVGLTQQMIGVGFIVSTWIGYGSAQAPTSSSLQWRFPLAFQAVPCAVIIFGLFFYPESPRHLVETDREEDALRVLRKLHYDGSNEGRIMAEFTEINTTIAAEKAITAPGWKIMFTVKQWRTRLMHAFLVQTYMYAELGITGSRNLLVIGIYNVVGPIANLFFIVFLVDRIGRRRPLIFGTIGIIIALICEAAINSQIDPNNPSQGLSIAGVFFLFCVSLIFSLSFGPVSWIYMSEVMPMPIRAKGSAFATGIGNWLVSTFFAQVSPIALGSIDWKYYFVFVAFDLVVTLPTVYLVFKETKHMTLEEVDLLFGERALGTLPDNLDEKGTIELVHQGASNQD